MSPSSLLSFIIPETKHTLRFVAFTLSSSLFKLWPADGGVHEAIAPGGRGWAIEGTWGEDRRWASRGLIGGPRHGAEGDFSNSRHPNGTPAPKFH